MNQPVLTETCITAHVFAPSGYPEKVNVLFICSRNRLRSPTAEELFASRDGITTASAGTSEDAENVISADLIEWADIIFAMETVHKRKLNQKFVSLLKTRRVVVLGIPWLSRSSHQRLTYMTQATQENNEIHCYLRQPAACRCSGIWPENLKELHTKWNGLRHV